MQVTRSSLRLSWLRNQTYVATGTSFGYARIFTNGVPDAPPDTSTEIGGATALLTVQGDSLYGVFPVITPVGSGTPSLLSRTVIRTGAASRGTSPPNGDYMWVNLVRMTKTGN